MPVHSEQDCCCLVLAKRGLLPFSGLIPSAPASHSGVLPPPLGKPKIGRKCRLFARSTSSPDSQFGYRRVPIDESLQPQSRIFPFCRDYRRRPGSITTAARGRSQSWEFLGPESVKIRDSVRDCDPHVAHNLPSSLYQDGKLDPAVTLLSPDRTRIRGLPLPPVKAKNPIMSG
jgi:hypothetical protein